MQRTASFFNKIITKRMGMNLDNFTNDDKLLELVKSIRVHGQGINKYDNVRTGINGLIRYYPSSDILIEKLKIFNDEIILRNKVAEYYNKDISKALLNNIFKKL